MNASIHNNEPAFDAQENPKVKFTGNQCAETTKKLWKWVDRLESPAVLVLPLYEKFIARLTQDLGKPIATGEFGAHMDVSLVNDGPVTIIIDSKQRE